MLGSRLRPLALGLLVLLIDCAALDKIPVGTCGNGVVDSSEDCDTFPNDATDPSKARCGAPSEGDFACHLRCGAQANGAPVCPEGWGCDTKGICREPSGQFSHALGFVSGGAVRVTVGDFDGDGRKDVVASGPRNARSASEVRVHFFDDLGALAQVSALPAALVSPAVFDHDHNGRDDIAFGIPSGTQTGPSALGVVSGLADRTFLPVVFPAVNLPDTNAVPLFVYLHAVDVRMPNGNDNAILLFAQDKNGSGIVSLDSDLGAASRLTRALPVGPDGMRGRPIAARIFDADATSACGEVVAAMQVPPVGRLVVLSPCSYVKNSTLTKWNQTPGAFGTFDLPSLADDSRGALVADVDSDGHPDVLVDTTDGPYVLYGNGTSLASPQKWRPSGLTAAPKMPLAAADLTGDGKTDFVFPAFVAVQKPDIVADGGADAGGAPVRDGTLLEPAKSAQQLQLWSDALIGQFNGDLFPDIVAIHAGSPDLEVYSGGAAGFTPSTVTTDGIVQAMTKGDFDGDHIEDLGFTQATSVNGTSVLSISYGRPTGGLDQPTRIGTVDKSLGLSALPHGSAPADLSTYSLITQAGHSIPSTALTLLTGSGDRQPLALLFFLDILSCGRTDTPCAIPRPPLQGLVTRQWAPLSLAAGPIVTRDQSAVLSYAVGTLTPAKAPGTADPFGVWVADGSTTAPGGLAAPTEQQVLDGQYAAYDDATRSATLATAIRDLDNLSDGLSEVLAMANATSGKDAVLLVVRPGRTPASDLKTLTGLKVSANAQLDAVDLDGDGFRDAIGLFGAAPDQQIVVFLNDGKGGFIVPGIPLAMPAAPAGAAPFGNPVSFAGIAVRGATPVPGPRTRTNALAVLTPTSILLATLRSDKQGFDVASMNAQLGTKLLTGATGVTAGDFNGDGVEDIAIADGAIRLILQQPARSAK